MNIGLIGCGSVVASLHLPVLARIPDLTIKWVCDVSIDRARRVARDWKISRAFSQIDDCGEVDAVLVATPVGSRQAILEKTTARGWHAFCEKPFASSATEHRESLIAATEEGVKLGAGYMRRYYWAVERARQLVQSQFLGELERIVASESAHLDRIGIDLSSYRNDRLASGGGVLLETGCHLIDEILFIAGASDARIAECSQRISAEYEVETIASGFVSCTSGCEAAMEIELSGIRPIFQGIVIQCEGGDLLLHLDPGKGLEIAIEPERSGSLALPNPTRINHLQYVLQAFREEWLHFIEAVKYDSPWEMASETGLLTSEVIDQCAAVAMPTELEVRKCAH